MWPPYEERNTEMGTEENNDYQGERKKKAGEKKLIRNFFFMERKKINAYKQNLGRFIIHL